MGRLELVVRREGTFARAYARKRPLGDLALDVRVRDMLLEEARVAGLARNAHVVPVLDVGEDEEGAFLVMDFVDGVPLDRIVERLGSRLPLQCALEIARQIAEGLHAVHETMTTDGAPMEIVHRDLSPSNVLVGFDGIARVTDFGIARARDRAAISQPGVRKGKRSYMAPEQLRGAEVDRRTDLFALGVVIAEMVAGARLYGEVTPTERARRTLDEPPPDIGELRADVPTELVALTFELMARERADRPRDARLVSTRLAAVRDQLRIEEGSIDLGELVRARFDDVRRDNDRMLAAALRDQDPTVQMALADASSLEPLPHDELTTVDELASDLRSLTGELPREPTGELPIEPSSELVTDPSRELPLVAEPSVVEPATTAWRAPVTRQPVPARSPLTTRAIVAVALAGAVALISVSVWWATRAVPNVAPRDDDDRTLDTTALDTTAPDTTALDTTAPDTTDTTAPDTVTPEAITPDEVGASAGERGEPTTDEHTEEVRADDGTVEPRRDTQRDRARGGRRAGASAGMDEPTTERRTTWTWE